MEQLKEPAVKTALAFGVDKFINKQGDMKSVITDGANFLAVGYTEELLPRVEVAALSEERMTTLRRVGLLVGQHMLAERLNLVEAQSLKSLLIKYVAAELGGDVIHNNLM